MPVKRHCAKVKTITTNNKKTKQKHNNKTKTIQNKQTSKQLPKKQKNKKKRLHIKDFAGPVFNTSMAF